MKKKNLFILRSPLQIINAIEAIEHFNLENNILVLIFNSLDTNTNQINELISLYKWEKIIKLEDRSKSKLFRYVKLAKELKKNSYDYLFFGNLGTIQKILIANLKSSNVYLLDDGTSTIMYYNNNIKTSKINKYNFRELRFLFFGLKVKIKNKINLFTYFDLEPINKIKVVHNSLENIKQNYFKSNQNQKNIYFIGQPLDDIGILNPEQYVNVIKKTIEYYNEKIIYIPHRAESIKLQNAIKNIQNELFEVQKVNVPIELYFLKNISIPSRLVSYNSTALTTLNMIYSDIIIDVINVPLEVVENKQIYTNSFKDLYENIQYTNMITFSDLYIDILDNKNEYQKC